MWKLHRCNCPVRQTVRSWQIWVSRLLFPAACSHLFSYQTGLLRSSLKSSVLIVCLHFTGPEEKPMRWGRGKSEQLSTAASYPSSATGRVAVPLRLSVIIILRSWENLHQWLKLFFQVSIRCNIWPWDLKLNLCQIIKPVKSMLTTFHWKIIVFAVFLFYLFVSLSMWSGMPQVNQRYVEQSAVARKIAWLSSLVSTVLLFWSER